MGSGPYGTEYLWYRVGQQPLWYHTEILILRHLDVEEVIESQARVLPFAIFLQNSKLNTPSGLVSLFLRDYKYIRQRVWETDRVWEARQRV